MFNVPARVVSSLQARKKVCRGTPLGSILDFLAKQGVEFLDVERLALDILYTAAVLLGEAYEDVVVGFCQVVDNAIDVGLGVLRALEIEMSGATDVKGVRDAEVIPQEFVQGGMLVDP